MCPYMDRSIYGKVENNLIMEGFNFQVTDEAVLLFFDSYVLKNMINTPNVIHTS